MTIYDDLYVKYKTWYTVRATLTYPNNEKKVNGSQHQCQRQQATIYSKSGIHLRNMCEVRWWQVVQRLPLDTKPTNGLLKSSWRHLLCLSFVYIFSELCVFFSGASITNCAKRRRHIYAWFYVTTQSLLIFYYEFSMALITIKHRESVCRLHRICVRW